MDTKKKRIVFLIVMLLLGGYFLATRISSPLPFVPPKFMRNYVTVNEVLENPKEYDGKVIRLRGKGVYEISMTLLICVPKSCECNETYGYFYLVDEIQSSENGDRFRDRIEISDVDCKGNECSRTCSPIYPGNNILYELIGKLVVNYKNEEPSYYELIDVDFASSRNFIADRWKPIRLETLEGGTP